VVPDSHDELALDPDAVPGSELAAIRRVWEILAADGFLGAIEELVRISHPDIEFHSYSARGVARPGEEPVEVLRGRDEILSFFREATSEGLAVRSTARSFDLEGDAVVVTGSARVTRPDGSFAETKLRWLFHFREGLLYAVRWELRAGT
jgi:ketosteroid isomerase-like protein